MPLSDIGKATIGGAAANVGSSVMGGIFSLIGAKKQRQFEQNMFDKQVAINRENWQLENQYNSPEAQMQRLKAAGLNPNLVYGNGANAMGGSVDSASPSVSDQSQKLMPFANLGNNVATAMNTLYDLRIKDAQANLLNQKAVTEDTVQWLNQSKAALNEIEQIKGNIDIKTYNQVRSAIVRSMQLKNEEIVTSITNTRADTASKQQSTKLAGAKTTETNLSNELLELEKNLYKGTLGLPSQSIEQILKFIMLLTRKK